MHHQKPQFEATIKHFAIANLKAKIINWHSNSNSLQNDILDFWSTYDVFLCGRKSNMHKQSEQTYIVLDQTLHDPSYLRPPLEPFERPKFLPSPGDKDYFRIKSQLETEHSNNNKFGYNEASKRNSDYDTVKSKLLKMLLKRAFIRVFELFTVFLASIDGLLSITFDTPDDKS